MNININNIDPKLLEEDDRIDAYLKGQMSAEEEQSFLKELKNNPELKEKAITMARLVKGLKEVGAEQERGIQQAILASSRQDVESAAKNATQVKAKVPAESKVKILSLRKTAKWVSIAASLICIVWLGFTYNSYRNTTALGEQYDNAFETGVFARGAKVQTETEKKLQTLFHNVKENDNIENTIHDLSLYWELSTMDTYNDYTEYSAEIGWNLAIAHLKNNDKKEAKAILKKLISISEEGSAISTKAKELLLKIE